MTLSTATAAEIKTALTSQFDILKTDNTYMSETEWEY